MILLNFSFCRRWTGGENPVWVGRRPLRQGDGDWGRNRVAVEANLGGLPRVARDRATLGWRPESRWDSQGSGGWRRTSPYRIWHGDYKFAQARIQPAVRWGNNGVTKVFGGTPNTARETRTLPFGRTAAVLTAARGQARWRHRANGCRRAGQTGREMRYDGCPRACAARFTLGYNMAGLQPLGGAQA